MRELDFIDWIRSQSEFDPKAVPVGPGDDCAVVNFMGRDLLITTDQVLDGVHFILSEHGPEAAGRKAMARNLSDVAAMAALPVGAVATVALPKGFARKDAEAIYRGLRSVNEHISCPVVGGDISTWSGPLAITVTVFARRAGATRGVDPILRSGAQVGDAICVTGDLGGAWKTQRHLTFTPRIMEGVQLALNHAPRAMIDISDGLATDLGHICKASGVGAEVFAEQVPIHPDAAGLEAALTDGEDYELLFTAPADVAEKLCAAQPLPVKVTRVGMVVEGEGVTLIRADGKREPLESTGWEHTT